MKLIEAIARTFGVPPGFFFEDFSDGQAGLLHEQVELLALVRNARVSSTQLRVILGWSTEIRQAVIHLISALTAHDEAQRRSAQGGASASGRRRPNVLPWWLSRSVIDSIGGRPHRFALPNICSFFAAVSPLEGSADPPVRGGWDAAG